MSSVISNYKVIIIVSSFKNRIKKYLPGFLVKAISTFLWPHRYWQQQQRNRSFKKDIENVRVLQKKALSNLKYKRPIKCVFLALFDSVWKYDNVYSIMEKDDRFSPVILVCPIINYGKENMLENMEKCYHTLKNKGYHVVRAYDSNNDKYIDLRKELQPDIIFYTNPYKGLIDDRYYLDNYKDILTVYVPYFFCSNCDYELSFQQPLHSLVWRRYVETDYHKNDSRKYSINKDLNVVVTGYPGIDSFIDPYYQPENVWCDKAHKRKRIIWAPHHSIVPVGLVYYSCFLQYMDYMLSLAEKYENSIELCFKPHPLLKNRLDKLWGKEKTNEYYGRWGKSDNTFFHEGQYTDLFLTSDAMIHDSASFIVEYLYLNKPVMRTLNGQDMSKQFSSFGLACLDCHYKAYNEKDVEQFVINVINGIDPLKNQRTKFVNDVLMPKGGMPSENIINDIIESIENQRL